MSGGLRRKSARTAEARGSPLRWAIGWGLGSGSLANGGASYHRRETPGKTRGRSSAWATQNAERSAIAMRVRVS